MYFLFLILFFFIFIFFLIKEPVIPLSYGKEFISAAKSGNFDAFPKLVNDLPTAHMDTLACLCRHWKRFIEDHNINVIF